jgi:DNA modification methylase
MPAPYYTDDAVTLYGGDCLDVLREIPADSVDAVVTDPPYGLGFMGREWDDLPPGLPFAQECLRVLKPGGYLLAFGGSRTWHRLAAAVEDAGFEIRDSIAWLYGSGFPKSLDVSKAIDKAAGAERPLVRQRFRAATGRAEQGGGGYAFGEDFTETAPATAAAAAWAGWGTALKPAFEPIVVGRKPLAGTVAANVQEHGTGALNIDGCRIEGEPWKAHRATGLGSVKFFTEGETPVIDKEPHSAGRWPTNVVLDESQAAELDKQTGVLTSGANPTRRGVDGNRTAYGDFAGQDDARPARGADSGGASRFFPTFRYEAKAPTSERPRDGETAHPTVKPLDLMRWLVRLVTPPGGTVLEPFAGSGTTAEACVIEGFQCVAIEREADYLPLIVARLAKPIQGVLL